MRLCDFARIKFHLAKSQRRKENCKLLPIAVLHRGPREGWQLYPFVPAFGTKDIVNSLIRLGEHAQNFIINYAL
jgi:hypothetical protein